MTLAEITLNALPVVQACGAERQEETRFAAGCERNRKAEVDAASVEALLGLVVEIAAAVGTLLLVSSWSLSRCGAALSRSARSTDPIRGLARTTARFQRAAAGAQRVAGLLDVPSLVQERPNVVPLKRVRGRIAFEDVRFA